MGTIRHNAILVTSWSGEQIEHAASRARMLGLQVLGPSDEIVNGYRSLLVCPDGSKEGWFSSDVGDQRRSSFRKWLRTQVYPDSSSALEWVEFAYGNDHVEAGIVASTWLEGE